MFHYPIRQNRKLTQKLVIELVERIEDDEVDGSMKIHRYLRKSVLMVEKNGVAEGL